MPEADANNNLKKPCNYYCKTCDIDIPLDDTIMFSEHQDHEIIEVKEGDPDPSLLKDFKQNNLRPAKLSSNEVKEINQIFKDANVIINNNEDILAEIVGLLSKTIKGDENYINRLLFNGLSCFTDTPSHLIVMERTSEGKTYPALEIAKHFPQENKIILGSATPQTFKYEHGVLVDTSFNLIQDKVDDIDKQLEDAATNKKPTVELHKKKRELLKFSKTLIDLRHKWIIFKEPPNHKLLEALYSTLSSDEEFSEHKFVNKTTTGKQQNFTVVFRGTPSMLICTARDETKNERWSETASRFEITSPLASQEKYKGGMNIIGKKFGLPGVIYNKHVISIEDCNRIKNHISKLILLIKNTNGELINPFIDVLSEIFPQEVGTRWRQYKRFNILMNLHCFCYSHQRPVIEVEGKWYPSIIKADVLWANKLMEDNQILPPAKLRWFTEVFLPAAKAHDYLSMKVSEIVEFANTKIGFKTNTRQVRQVYLESLVDNGFVEKEQDPDYKNRDIYSTYYRDGFVMGSPIPQELLSPSNTDLYSSKIPQDSKIPLDASCVSSFVKKYLEGNFRVELYHNPISLDQYIKVVVSIQNSLETPKFEPKNKDGILESKGILGNPEDFTRTPILPNRKKATCSCGAGPYYEDESSKSSGNLIEFHKKLGHEITWE